MDRWSFGGRKLKACIRRKSLKEEDCISELPDDVLMHMVTLLTLKEAGRTSVLSKRWRYIWTYTLHLNFDASNIIEGWWKFREEEKSVEGEDKEEEDEEEEDEEVHKKDERMYYNWVDQAVRSHKASIIDEFRVCFDLYESRKEKMDNWLKFAIEKRVKRLELNIAPFNKSMSYTFPSILSLCCNSLTSLNLAFVDVTGEVLENFLCNCQNLESISVEQSESLVSLIVAGPSSLSLKFLKISCCFKIQHLEISAPNLTSCHYAGPKLKTPPFKFTPKLAQLFIGGASGTHAFSSFSDISSCISAIEELTLDSIYTLKRVAKLFPVCTRLKMLHVTVDPKSDKELFCLRFLLMACPVLEKFVLELEITGLEMKRTRRPKKVEACSFDHLKVVEIIGFVGWKVVTAFAVYLIKNAVSLEKIIIEPIQDVVSPDPKVPERRRAMEKAKQLCSKFHKPGTEVEIRYESSGSFSDDWSA